MNTAASTGPDKHPHGRFVPTGIPAARIFAVLQIAAVFGLVCLAVFFRHTPEFATLSITFVSIFLEALPFMLLGAAIGGLIDVFVSKSAIARLVPAGRLPAILLAAGLGLVFPVCECAIVPVVRRLLSKGLPLGAGIAFLLGGPIVNPLVALSTAVAYGGNPTMVGCRLAIGYLVAVAVGLTIDRCFTGRPALVKGSEDSEAHPAEPLPAAGIGAKIVRAMRHGAADFIDIGRFLVFGAFVAGLLQTLVSRGALTVLFGSPVSAILAMMVLAILLSLCSEADAFVAASFRTTLPAAAQLAFMVLGPMLDLKLIAMYFGLFRKRLILVLSTTTFIGVFLSMLAVNWMGR